MHWPMILLLGLAALATPALHAQQIEGASLVTPFSKAKAGAELPANWQLLKLGSHKKITDYKFVEDQGQMVLHAHAEGAATGLLHLVKFDIGTAPMAQFRWKISGLIEDADNSVAAKEDAPARIILGFEGDRSKLKFRERTASTLAKTASGRELPYAQLIYIWSTRAPVGTVIANPHTNRVQMVVATTGAANVGKWVTVTRNVGEDFKRAFGEEPGLLTEVGVMTDTDNTGATVDAWYGDIRFVPSPK